ncbi:MAG: hypothetical protein A4E57_01367 [Syntrophorhabdaceae bacterium PtaU1.Bin034]|jgi:hypothetical protein|nr:MAG: hypothetical protein A4E57_01367 [Syntrophorhabdaceae bacterium PtaU1.Bin034]
MIKKCLTFYLIFAMFVIGIAPRVEAAFSPSETIGIGLSPSVRAEDTEKIRIVLENKLVAQRLRDLGYSPEEAMTRLSQLTDEQVHNFAQKLDDLKVGGDGLGFVIAVLVIIILVIVILQLTGRRVMVTK